MSARRRAQSVMGARPNIWLRAIGMMDFLYWQISGWKEFIVEFSTLCAMLYALSLVVNLIFNEYQIVKIFIV